MLSISPYRSGVLHLPRELTLLLPLNYMDCLALSLTCRLLYRFINETWQQRLEMYYGVRDIDAKSLYKKAMRAGYPMLYTGIQVYCAHERRDVMTLDHQPAGKGFYFVITTLTGECYIYADKTCTKVPVDSAIDALLYTDDGVHLYTAVLHSGTCTVIMFDVRTSGFMKLKSFPAKSLLFYSEPFSPATLSMEGNLEYDGVVAVNGKHMKDYYLGIGDNCCTREDMPAMKHVLYIYKGEIREAYIDPDNILHDGTYFNARDVADICTLNEHLMVLYRNGELKQWSTAGVVDKGVTWMRSTYDASTALAYVKSVHF